MRSKKRLVRFGLVAANLALLAIVVGFVVKAPSTTTTSVNKRTSGSLEQVATAPLDQLSSADIAVNVARMARLPEATSVVNHADSVSAQLATSSVDVNVVAKPQIMSGALPSKKDIKSYVTKAGDTVSSIAERFGVSSDSIRWSNDLTGDYVGAGITIYVPPAGQNGIVYRVQAGDTPESLARKYNTTKELIIAFNDAEISGLKPGEIIMIPDGTVPAPAFVYNYGGFSFGSSPIYGYNGYDFGWCTWWAAKRRADIGRAIPSNLGDAYSWVANGRLSGLNVSSTPTQGAVIWTNTYYPGHVGFVERVLPDGSAWVSDMNSHGQVSPDNPTPAGGWNRVSWRLVSPGEFSRFRFIN